MKDSRVPEHADRTGLDRGEPFEFHFEGTSVQGYWGETIGAALMAAGILTLRHSRRLARPRGLFCGIGVCFDCLVIVDGMANTRACITPVSPGMEIHSQGGSGDVLHAD